jgi:type I restriction enzyme S subunit
MVVPLVSEQTSLVEAINTETATANTAIARTEREIALMQEYRTRLTADVVTGKLDVRAAAAHLPALATEATPDPATEEPLEETDSDEIAV